MEIAYALVHAIEHYLQGNASKEEQQLVQDWYHSFKDDEVEIPVNIIELRTRVAERIWVRLEQTVQANARETTAPIVPLYRRAWFRLSTAAAIILLFVGGWYFYSGKTDKTVAASVSPAKAVKHDVEPGGNKAILTLNDGTRIVLDTAANGMVLMQGKSKVIKLANGQVAYDAGKFSAADNLPITYNTLTTPKGGQYKLTLPDGSEVWLNAASSIRYPTVFTGNERKVEITGEVYFEVRPIYTAGNANGKKMPFIVVFGISSTPSLDDRHKIEVVGTHFNVMAYDDETIMKTTLLEGIIKQSMAGGQSPEGSTSWTILKPGQQTLINTQNNVTRIVDDSDVDEAVAWKNGLFQFTDTDIQTIMRQLARWYAIDVKFAGNIPTMKLTGKAPRNISLSSMLKILALSDVKYQIDGNVLTVMP